MNKLNFNDSAVAGFYTEHDTAVLEVHDVHCDGALVKVVITVEDYTTLQSDNGPDSVELEDIPTLEMLTDDGNVVVFESTEDSFSTLITWHEYKPLKLHTRNYKVKGRSLRIDIGAPYADER